MHHGTVRGGLHVRPVMLIPGLYEIHLPAPERVQQAVQVRAVEIGLRAARYIKPIATAVMRSKLAMLGVAIG